MRSDRQLGARLRRAFEAEPPPALSPLDVRQRAARAQRRDGDRLEQQRRELEQVRRRFAEVGKRMGSAFEPAPTDDHQARQSPPPTSPPDRLARPRWQLAAALLVVFLLGGGFGHLLPRAGADRPGATSPPPTAAAASTPPPPVRTVTRVPPACLETARKADQMIHLFTINDRSRRLAEALKAYTLASQACRQQARP